MLQNLGLREQIVFTKQNKKYLININRKINIVRGRSDFQFW